MMNSTKHWHKALYSQDKPPNCCRHILQNQEVVIKVIFYNNSFYRNPNGWLWRALFSPQTLSNQKLSLCAVFWGEQGLAAQARSSLMKPIGKAKLQTLSIAVWLGSKANTNVLFPSVLQATHHSAKPWNKKCRESCVQQTRWAAQL